jgi:Tol biopolymer transport system component
VSADGRFVAFASDATNLVSGDTNGKRDIFLFNRTTGGNRRVSASTSGSQANGSSFSPAISSDGQIVAFESLATNLVSGDTNGVKDLRLHALSGPAAVT